MALPPGRGVLGEDYDTGAEVDNPQARHRACLPPPGTQQGQCHHQCRRQHHRQHRRLIQVSWAQASTGPHPRFTLNSSLQATVRPRALGEAQGFRRGQAFQEDPNPSHKQQELPAQVVAD